MATLSAIQNCKTTETPIYQACPEQFIDAVVNDYTAMSAKEPLNKDQKRKVDEMIGYLQAIGEQAKATNSFMEGKTTVLEFKAEVLPLLGYD